MRGLVGSNIGSGRDLPHQSLFFVFLAWILYVKRPTDSIATVVSSARSEDRVALHPLRARRFDPQFFKVKAGVRPKITKGHDDFFVGVWGGSRNGLACNK